MTNAQNGHDQEHTAQNERLSFALEAAGVGTWDYNLVTGQAEWSSICKQLFGLNAEIDVSAATLLNQVHEEDRERVALANKAALDPFGDGQHDISFRTMQPDGRLRWVQAKGKTIINDQHQVVRFSGIVQDVTQSVVAKQQLELARLTLEESEARVRSIIATAPAGIGIFVGRDLIIELPNQTFIEIVGKGPDIEGMPLRDVMPELITGNQPFLQILDDVYTSGQMYQSFGVQVNIVQHGVMTHNFYNITYTPLLDRDGNVYAILDIAVDVTSEILARQKLAESEARYKLLSSVLEEQVQERTQELETANEELAATNEELTASNDELTKSAELLLRSNSNLQQFAYIASHDLQEPLRKIQQFGSLLHDQHQEALGEGAEYLKRMQQAANRMSVLIRDLLAFSRISTTQDTLELVPLAEIAAMAMNDLELVIQETGAEIYVDRLPTVIGDASQLSQLFTNLLSNALKFHQKNVAPRIHIRAYLLTDAQLPATVKPTQLAAAYHQIDIADNGIGFEQKYASRIFQVFQRLHGKSTYAGTGIGLAICEKVVANHGGTIVVSSQPNTGSTFSIYLPI